MSVQNKVTGLFGICSVIHLSKTKVETITLMFSVYTNGKTEGGDDDPLFSVYSLHSRSSKTVESWKSQSKFRSSLSWTLSRWEFLNIQSTFEPLPSSPLHPYPPPFHPSPPVLLTLNWLQTNFRQWHLTHPLKYPRPHKYFLNKIFSHFLKRKWLMKQMQATRMRKVQKMQRSVEL